MNIVRSFLKISATLALTSVFLSPAMAAKWKYIAAGETADIGDLVADPDKEWNRSNRKIGKRGVAWTQDGLMLNSLELFWSIESGKPLYRERSKKRNPMPKFDSSILLLEFGDFFERSFRTSKQVTDFELLSSEPVSFIGSKGLRLKYRYTLPNDGLERLGEARMVKIDGFLYVANFHAPKLHYFDHYLADAVQVMESLKIN